MDVILIYDSDYNDENLQEKINQLQKSIACIIKSECKVLKVEPWNSVKVTFSIPNKAAKQLKELARNNSSLLNELDILSVQVQGEDVIQLAVDSGNGSSQGAILQENHLASQQDSASSNAFPANMNHLTPNANSQLPQQISAVPKKRSRKSKDKQPSKTSKSNQNKVLLPSKMLDQQPGLTIIQPKDIISQESPQFSLTQLSPSVEDIVTEAWDQHRQSTEEDIMDIQLQSFTSGANVSPGNDQSILNPSPFDQHSLHDVIPKHQPRPPANAGDVIHPVQQELQKQHSVPSNFAPGQMPLGQNVCGNQTIGMNMGTNTMNQMAPDQAVFSQQINSHGLNQEITQTPQIANMPANFHGTNQVPNSQFANVSPQMHWPANSMMMSQTYRVQNSNPASSYIGQSNQNEISSHSPAMPSHGPMMTSPGSVMSQGNMMLSPNNMITSQSNLITSPNPMMASQGNMLTPPGSMSPAVPTQHQFPFSFPNSNKQQGAFQGMGQNMSKDSPLLVNLLQNEGANNGSGLASPTQFPGATPAAQSQKPKRKKPSRKKKPSKSSVPTAPTVAGPVHAVPGAYPMQGQFVPQNFHGEIQNHEQIMQQPNVIKTSYPTSKTPVIEAISRSDVGGNTTSYSGDSIIATEIQPPNQMPQLRRHNSFPASRSAFPAGFDPSKAVMQPKPPHSNMPQQQPMYMSQMSAPYPGYKPGHGRPMIQQQQGENGQLYQASNFQHGPPQMQMVQQQQQQQVVRAQRFPTHRPLTPAQMQAQGAFQQSAPHAGNIRSPAPLPTLHQQRPMHQQQILPHQKRSSLAGKLSTGVMSIMLKTPCRPTCHSIPPAQQLHRVQSALARKSPGSSMESLSSPSPKMSYPSPKMNHPSAPSPQVHSYPLNSPSSMPAPVSNKTGSQSRPRSRNFAPAKTSPRQPSLEQYGGMAPNSQNRNYFNNNPTSAAPTNPGPMNVPGHHFPFHHANPNNKPQDNHLPGEAQFDRSGPWTQPSLISSASNPALSWQNQTAPTNGSTMQAYIPSSTEATKVPESHASFHALPSPAPPKPAPPQGVVTSLSATTPSDAAHQSSTPPNNPAPSESTPPSSSA